MIGTTELIVIAGVIFVLFGATAIPKFARSLGRAKKEFALGVKEEENEDQAKNGDSEKSKLKKQKTVRNSKKSRKKA